MKSSDLPERPPGTPATAAASPLVFVFFDAWTLITGRHAGMVEHILAHGFRLLDFEFKTLSEADAEEIYRTNHPIREGNSWHVARLIYPMGRSLGLLFGLGDPDWCACLRMQNLKGKANPALNRAGQLRYDFLAPNRCLSLMHSSDTRDQVRREGAVFFTAERLERAHLAAREFKGNSERLMHELGGANTELGIERIDEPALGTLFARVRLRLVKELQRACPSLSSRQDSLFSYRALWDAPGRGCPRVPVTAEAKQYLPLVARERPLIEAIAASIDCAIGDRGRTEYYRPPTYEPAMILSCLRVLNHPETYSQWDSDKQLPRDLLHDRWERLLFRTHLFNFDDMLSAAGGPP
jgi:nucleoside diphosphate kinase